MQSPSQQADDCRLLKLATQGDAGAFAQLVTAHRQSMLSAAIHVTRDFEDAQDAVQDALLVLWRDCLMKGDWLQGLHTPLAWLLLLARQAGIRILIRKAALKRGGKDVHAFDVEVRRSLYRLAAHRRNGSVVESCEQSPDDDTAFKRLGMVQRLAPQLPPALLGPLNAFFSAGESLQSMAQRRGCTPDEVKRTLSAGVQTLRHLVNKDPEVVELAA